MQKTEPCLICWDLSDEKQQFQLTNCKHKFCQECFKLQCEQLVDDGIIDLDHYKCPICLQIILEKELFEILDEPYKQKYQNLLENKNKADEIRRENIRHYIKNKKSLNLCRCPWCELISFRETGCNFIRCYSLECQGKFVYCAQCDQGLSDEDHDIHYENNNAFTGRCRVKRDGKWVDRSKIFY